MTSPNKPIRDSDRLAGQCRSGGTVGTAKLKQNILKRELKKAAIGRSREEPHITGQSLSCKSTVKKLYQSFKVAGKGAPVPSTRAVAPGGPKFAYSASPKGGRVDAKINKKFKSTGMQSQ